MPRVARVKGDTAGREIINVMVEKTQAADHVTGLIGWRGGKPLIGWARRYRGGVGA